MSSKQTAQQRSASARVQRMRRSGLTSLHSFAGAGVASVPHVVGMRTAANDHGGRNHDAADRTIVMRPRS